MWVCVLEGRWFYAHCASVSMPANAYNMRNVTMLYFDTVSTGKHTHTHSVWHSTESSLHTTLIMSIRFTYKYVHTKCTYNRKRRRRKKNNFWSERNGDKWLISSRLNRCFIQMFKHTSLQHKCVLYISYNIFSNVYFDRFSIIQEYQLENAIVFLVVVRALFRSVLKRNVFYYETKRGSSFQ